ncbi:MAG: RelA/SpoT domain-containing protein, partial [Erysipelotrichales bacterium]
MNNELVKSFIQKRDEYDVLCDVAQTLIINTLNEHDISVFDVKGRVKDVSSLAQKIERKKYENKIKDEEYRNYKELEDITDLCGIRIITYYSDEVDLVAQLIERELKIDKENSIDKRNTTLPGSFGYSSLHYVVEIDDARAQLEEYNIIKGMKF